MNHFRLVLSILLILSYNLVIAQIELLPFDFGGRDSLLNCKIIERYDDLVRYINLYVDPNIPQEDKLHINTSIYILLSDDPISGFKPGIEDISLENIPDKLYQRHDYLFLLNSLTNFNYAYQKDFLSRGAPYPTNRQTFEQNYVMSDFGEDYKSPFYHFGMNFIENTKQSYKLESQIRTSSSVGYKNHLMLKELRGRYSKSLNEREFRIHGEAYKEIYNDYENICKTSFDQRDSSRLEYCQNKLVELEILDNKISRLELKFRVIYESEIKDYNEQNKVLSESLAKCNCDSPEPPKDNDGDGFDHIIDCDDNNKFVYPGGPIDCEKWGDDDNCDGITDVCCKDNDGDGFYSSIDCDCNQSLLSQDIRNKCDCDDNDKSVYPGAPINCDNLNTDDNCDGKKDSIQFQSISEIDLNPLDNLLPPFGLTKFGRDKSFYTYSGLILTGIGSTVYHKVQSNKWSKKYERAETFRRQDEFYEEANKNHKRFLLSAALTTGVYLTSLVDLRIRYAKYNKIRNEIKERNAGCALIYDVELNAIDITDSGIGPSFKFRF